MGIIPCDLGCKYQNDGFCTLESIDKVNNTAPEQGCAYYIDMNIKNDFNVQNESLDG